MTPDVTPEPTAPERIAIVGIGALGAALARRLVARGSPPEILVSRSDAAARLGADLGVAHAADLAAARTADIVVLAVPDSALADVAVRLRDDAGPWTTGDGDGDRPRLVIHTSGVVGADALGVLADAGADVLAFHPAQTFAAGTPPEAFDGAAVALDGSAKAIERGRDLASVFGMRPVVVPPGSRAAYHLALSVASNFAVTLAALAAEILGTVGLPPADAAALVRPLLAGTVANLARSTPEQALSGPVVRGDAATVGRHLDVLAASAPHLTPVYAALATETVRVAVRSGRLPPATAEAILDRLHAALGAAPSLLPVSSSPR